MKKKLVTSDKDSKEKVLSDRPVFYSQDVYVLFDHDHSEDDLRVKISGDSNFLNKKQIEKKIKNDEIIEIYSAKRGFDSKSRYVIDVQGGRVFIKKNGSKGSFIKVKGPEAKFQLITVVPELNEKGKIKSIRVDNIKPVSRANWNEQYVNIRLLKKGKKI